MTPKAKKRPEPYQQGCMADIYKWFVAPFLRYKPHATTLKEWHEFLFHAKDRDISRWIVERPFKMLGEYYAAGAVCVQGVGYRDMKPGDVLWARFDKKCPEFVDVEALIGQGQASHVYKLSEAQWCYIVLNCTEAEREKK